MVEPMSELLQKDTIEYRRHSTPRASTGFRPNISVFLICLREYFNRPTITQERGLSKVRRQAYALLVFVVILSLLHFKGVTESHRSSTSDCKGRFLILL